ncbi:ATP-grasp domain-containing protein [Actinomyces lilanjuaniae]|uniref:ATP-grasp domain-containing protein n=1 Tax=Actinomyces lilanjuaniae TaxID=2321394 RepID=A0ABM6Z4J6_9ACTO|nr:ATP-grasp domain-containing protein [Actinomyces lilanjuaniae]AYD90100.1 ATP-grasp domain-containing protein [Actinomyces lilanjuaniae]
MTTAPGSLPGSPPPPAADHHGQRVLILGASLLQVPMIRRARDLGMRPVVVDMDPAAPGVCLAEEFHAVSTNDIDTVLDVARAHDIHGVATVGTDMPVRTIAAVAQALGLPGVSPTTALTCTDKAVMAQAFADASLPHPAFRTVSGMAELEEAVAQIGLPCILKPLDSSGSRGVIQVSSADQLPTALDYTRRVTRDVSPSGQVLVEELLTGPEISCEVLCIAGTAHVVALTDKATTGAPHFIETGHTQPAVLDAPTTAAVTSLVQDTVEATGITDGPAHIEMILTSTGPRLVELGARMAGDFVASHLVPLTTGVDFIGLVLRQACGEPIDPPMPRPQGGAVRFLDAPQGTLVSFRGLTQAHGLPGVREVLPLARAGQRIGGLHSSTDRVGVVIAQGKDHDDAARICEAARNLITVEVQP